MAILNSTNSARVILCVLLAVGMLATPGCVKTSAPEVTGITQSAAEAAIKSAGLVLGSVTGEFSATIPAGDVIRQDPPASTPLSPGGTVNLVVSRGPEPVVVPDVVGLSRIDAATLLANAGLLAGGITFEFSNTVPSGGVLAQTPAAGAQAAAGDAVALSVSKGPWPVAVPNVCNMTQAAAEAALLNAGLAVGAVIGEINGIVPVGSVIRQNPPANRNVPPGSTVALTVSIESGLIAVPDLAGMPENLIPTFLVQRGLTLGVTTREFSLTVPAGSTVSQHPAANTMVNRGTAVNLVVSRGREAIVPNVVGMTQAAAVTAIIDEELVVGAVSRTFSDTITEGSVISQSPAGNAHESVGTTVDLVVSSGPQEGGLVDVPDENLAAAIRGQLGLAAGSPLTTVDMAALVSFFPLSLDIADLTGLEHAVNLKELWIGDNQVADLTPLAELSSLEWLMLNHNELADLTPLAGLTSLKALALDHNQLADISPLAGLANLEALSLGHNQVTDLAPLAGLANLSTLWVGNNEITDVTPLAGLSKLNDLILFNNQITSVAPFVSGAIFTAAASEPFLRLGGNPLSSDALTVEIPALQTRGVTVLAE